MATPPSSPAGSSMKRRPPRPRSGSTRSATATAPASPPSRTTITGTRSASPAKPAAISSSSDGAPAQPIPPPGPCSRRSRWPPKRARRCSSGSRPRAPATASPMPRNRANGGRSAATRTAACSARAPPAASSGRCSASTPCRRRRTSPRRKARSASTSSDCWRMDPNVPCWQIRRCSRCRGASSTHRASPAPRGARS